MESARKRKANATPSSAEGSGAKKLKLLNTRDTPSAPRREDVQQIGQKLMAHLRHSKDKNGRLIATQFLTLPPKDELPDYYEFTRMPLALDQIEARVDNDEYPTLTHLESDLKRLVQNAKDYNAPKSEIFEDAERLRKAVYNYMKIHNPAYKDPEYASFPTPIPPHLERSNGVNGHAATTIKLKAAAASPAPERGSSRRSVTTPRLSEAPDRKSSVAPSTTNGDGDGDVDVGDGGSDFTGKTFQQAQVKLLTDLINYTEDDVQVFWQFVNLPPRSITDYYYTIKHPVCLKKVQKRARGQHGRAAPTGITDFKTWDAFEDEASFIWRNAQTYNEEGSDLYTLAEEFKEMFLARLAIAKDQVDEPSGPKLKLTTKPKVTLNLSQRRNSPTPAANQATPAQPAATGPSSVTVDSDALARQREMVRAGVDGRQTPSTGPAAITPRPPSSQTAATTNGVRPQSSAAGSPSNVVKNERTTTQSPALTAATPAQTNGTSMPPPPTTGQTSYSPHPSQQQPSYAQTHVAPALPPPAPVRPYPAANSNLPLLTLATHPHLPLPKPFSLTLPPHPTLAQQSTTFTLPSTHYFLQISPTVSRDLSMGARAYRVFVSLNGLRLQARDTVLDPLEGKRRLVFECTLRPGVNRVEVEVVAVGRGGKNVGGGEGGDGEGGESEPGLEVEKVTVFIGLEK